ncbi:uncharacterized protein LOC121361877, partial [Pyrgilauda ruficollis]|uniref:uncharacterized protein LOC121361877 n=1 Tax=Pyrgilauda ruficollis TaxID=221976 RepID=UPI001B871303
SLSLDERCTPPALLIRGPSRILGPDPGSRPHPRALAVAREGFSRGKHYWEVELGDGSAWELGVLREEIRDSLRDSLRDPIPNSIPDSLQDPIPDSLQDSTLAPILNSISNSILDSIPNSIPDPIPDPLRDDSLRDDSLPSIPEEAAPGLQYSQGEFRLPGGKLERNSGRCRVLGVLLDQERRVLEFFDAEEKQLLGSLPLKISGNLFPFFRPGSGGNGLGIRPVRV